MQYYFHENIIRMKLLILLQRFVFFFFEFDYFKTVLKKICLKFIVHEI